MGCNWSKRSSAANEPVAVGPYEELEEDQEGSRKKPATLSFRAEMEGGGERSSTFDHIPREGNGAPPAAGATEAAGAGAAGGDDERVLLSMGSSTVGSSRRGSSRTELREQAVESKGAVKPRLAGMKPPPKKPPSSLSPGKAGGMVVPSLKLDLTKGKAANIEPSEQQLRVEKLRRYEGECTKLEDFLFVSGVTVAHNKALLVGLGITHIINCAGTSASSPFPDVFTYTTLFVDDVPGADLLCHLPAVTAVLDECKQSGGAKKVLVHCHQGVSRSCSLCISYAMLRLHLSFDQALARVKAARGVCNPNPGFINALVDLGKRVGLAGATRGGTLPSGEKPKGKGESVRAFRVEFYFEGRREAGAAAVEIGEWEGALEEDEEEEGGAEEAAQLSSSHAYILQTPNQV
ncbi:protein-tyrosine phosphatase-like protein, partial [Baffinella frigidus]